MTRREAISRVSLLLGGVIIGADAFLTGCKPSSKTIFEFTDKDIALLNEIADTILPATSTPGAKDANVAPFMVTMVKDCYKEKDQEILAAGLAKIQEAADNKYNKDFMQLSAEQRTVLLTEIDVEQQKYTNNKKEDDAPHYFRMYKELTLLAYFTSEKGASQALSYIAVPGKFEAITEYKKGQRAWALN
ncbi:gluconate 2-dehydrogenase subunit 3 family protein [Mucilaginibacter limnophilus]|uniref:Gluconate 2-dehydrogenase subunit 3 family protein n=1 Tax=Mucilaginibacter limnophilus TaxID=1932778 RepID=A0A3S2UPT4_9SPHI|nr:gluconate 2-dehydrogenase subunit 3 family protein [Mucilaginibacter limnophilus]RVU03051.1 gluconate 2-dehydrogenase subunit 3 family protein [Mucilaginibacter limnophilus]